MNDIAQGVAQALNNTLNLCLVYLAGTIGLVLLMIGIFKFAAWIVDRRKDVPPSSKGRTFDFESKDVGSNPTGGSEDEDG